MLVRSDAWLVKVNPKRSELRAARCAVNYRAEIPTLVHENMALCLAEQKDRRYPTSRETYRVIGTKFLGARPGEQR